MGKKTAKASTLKVELTKEEQEQIDHDRRVALGKVIADLNKDLDKVDANGYFWCPKEIAGHGLGFTLYIYGGHAFDLYYGGINNSICMKKFDKKYSKFDSRAKDADFPIEKYVSPTWEKIGNADVCLSTVKSLGDEWNYIFKMFKNWAMANCILKDGSDSNRKTNMERYRENIIANRNRENENGIIIIEMESSIALEKPTIRRDGTKHSHAKPDMIGLRKEDDTYIISFIEYKCTTNAVSGNVSLPEHYEDMHAYYKNSKVIEGIVERYNFAREVFGESERIDVSKCKCEIVFLFSHISETDKDSKQLKYTWIGSKIIQMMQVPGYASEDIRFMVVKKIEEDLLTQDKQVAVEFDLSKNKEGLEKQANKKDYMQEQYKKIGKRFI